MRSQQLPGPVQGGGRFVKDRIIGLEDVRHPGGDVEGDLNVGGGGLRGEVTARVRRGETIEITEHGTPVAWLVSFERPERPAILVRLEAEGRLRPAKDPRINTEYVLHWLCVTEGP